MKPDIAVIDIGSNSVRLMLAAAESGRVRSMAKRLNTTRLAKGIDATGCLAPDRVRDTVDAIETFFGAAKQYDVPVIAYATSAVRDAENRAEFTALVRERTGLVIRVLSGEEEGRLAFSAVTGGEGTVFDIGGGSFQIVTRTCAQSFPCGCVRAKERCDAGDTDTLERELFCWMDEKTCVPERVPAPVYGVGGTISTIGALLASQTRFDPDNLASVTPSKLDRLIRQLAAIPEPARMKHPLLVKRGDVILQGATILKYMMTRTHTDCVIPSDRDGMEGIAEAFLSGTLNKV